MEKLAIARAFNAMVHAKHTYADGPYTDHTDDVENILADAGMSTEDDRIRAALHDTIEDIDPLLRKMAQDFIFTNFGYSTYSVIWALSGFGHNRKSRNANAYAKIARYTDAADYKVADRISNWEAAIRGVLEALAKGEVNEFKLKKANMYAKEDDTFIFNVVRHASNTKLIERYEGLKAKHDDMLAQVAAFKEAKVAA